MKRIIVAGCLVLSCSSTADKQRECDRIAEDIRVAADKRGLPRQGVCNNPNVPEFASACESLRKCNAELADM